MESTDSSSSLPFASSSLSAPESSTFDQEGALTDHETETRVAKKARYSCTFQISDKFPWAIHSHKGNWIIENMC